LGGAFDLDFCQSVFDNASLCSFATPYLQQNFTLEWFMGANSLGVSTNSTPFHLDTSLFSALFNSPGNYLISLSVAYVGGVTPLLSDDSMQLTLFVPPPIISEPAAGLIFLAGIGGLGLAIRRRRNLK
jgi:hypothetical protein